jgi:hypothetical protein
MVEQLDRRFVRRFAIAPVALAFALTPALAASAHAASPVPLGTADSFALLAGSTITNTGPTTVTGDIGLCCSGLATPGFGSLTQPAGAQYGGPGTAAATAQDDLDIAYGDAAGQAVTNTVPVDLSLSGTPATPLLPGVYQSTAHGALAINTGLTLDFQGDPNAVFIFQGTTLTTAAGAAGSVTIVNGGASPSTCNVYWQLSDETQGVTLGADSAMKGTTMALGASVLGSGATVQGRVLTRRSKAVTLDANTITRSACSTATAGGGSGTSGDSGGSGTTTTPAITLVAQRGGSTATGVRPSAAAPSSATPSGTARLVGPRAPVRGPFKVRVTGHAISSVTFTLDGKRVGRVAAKRGRTVFAITINPRGQTHRVHRVTARITFTRQSHTRAITRRVTYMRTLVGPRGPRFTG